MKIVYCIAGTYNSGGMERVLTDKANWLTEHGHEVSIVTTDQRGRQPFFQLNPAIRCYDLDVNYEANNGGSFVDKLVHYPGKQWRHRRRLRRLLSELRPDVTVSMFCNDASFLSRLPVGGAKVLEIHFSRFKRLQYGRRGIWAVADRLRSRMDERCVRRYDAFVVLTEEDRGYWGELPNIHVIANPATLHCPEPSPLTAHRVLAVGRLSYQKGFERLLEAWALVQAQAPDWQLRILGRGEMLQPLTEQAERLGIADSVEIGHTTTDMAEAYREASILAMTSRYEGLPMVLIEAQSAGLPVVTFDCQCGPRDVIADGVNGYIVPQGDTKTMAERIVHLIKNHELCAEFSRNALARSVNYDLDTIMKRWCELFTNVSKKMSI